TGAVVPTPPAGRVLRPLGAARRWPEASAPLATIGPDYSAVSHTFAGNPMPLVSMRQLLDHAAENGYGIPAFNVNNLEQVQAVMAAENEVSAPVIMQASAAARKYAGEAFIKHLIQAAVE